MSYREQYGNGNGKDLAGMGGIGNTENHSRTSLVRSSKRSRAALCVFVHQLIV